MRRIRLQLSGSREGSTNVSHPWIDDWNGYTDVGSRCLVPFTVFAEPTKLEDGSDFSAQAEELFRLSHPAMAG